MQGFKEELGFVEELEKEYKESLYEVNKNQRQLFQVKSILKELQDERKHSLMIIYGYLKETKLKMTDKIQKIKTYRNHFDKEFKNMQKIQIHKVPSVPLHSQNETNDLSFEVQNVQMGDPLSRKFNRAREEFDLKSNSLRDRIHEIKLQVSLSELEIKGIASDEKKKSQKAERGN